MGSKKSKPPDVKGAAQIEGQFSRETARDVTYADRPDQVGPFGSVGWETYQDTDPATGEKVTRWKQTTALDPRLENVANREFGFMQTRDNMAAGAMGRAAQEMGGAPQWDQFGNVIGFDPTQQREAASNAAYERSMMRLDPQFNQEQQQLEINLRNRGLRPGDEAYDTAMSNFGRRRTDAYEMARRGAISEGRGEFDVMMQANQRANALRDQRIQEYIAKRGYSLGEVEKLRETGLTIDDIANMVG